MKTFNDYNFNEFTKKFISLNKFEKPTPIQDAVIPYAIRGRDIIAISATGTGKTHAFLIPIMEKIDTTQNEVQAVIIAPTRELAVQIFEFSKEMVNANPNINIKLITGGINKDRMIESLSIQPHIVIGTPGRIKDLFLDEGVLRVDTCNYFVLDEADMILEFGFLDDVDAICSKMPEKLQMLAFSATIPMALKHFLKKYMHNSMTIDMQEESNFNPKINHILVPCKHKSYSEIILEIKDGFMPYVCLIVANTREEASKIALELRENGVSLLEIHGGLTSRERKQAMKELTNLTQTYVVATDIASRGLDIEGITHVISCGFPMDLDFYIHRSGRTGRSGKEGTCFALYHESDTRAIKTLQTRGISFSHRVFRDGKWRDLKPFGYKRKPKNDLVEKEIAKVLTRKNTKVKPGYKKKRKQEIERIKRKQKREFIKSQIKKQQKERNKQKQILKSRGEL